MCINNDNVSDRRSSSVSLDAEEQVRSEVSGGVQIGRLTGHGQLEL